MTVASDMLCCYISALSAVVGLNRELRTSLWVLNNQFSLEVSEKCQEPCAATQKRELLILLYVVGIPFWSREKIKYELILAVFSGSPCQTQRSEVYY